MGVRAEDADPCVERRIPRTQSGVNTAHNTGDLCSKQRVIIEMNSKSMR